MKWKNKLSFKRIDDLDTYQKQNLKLLISSFMVLILLVSSFALLGISIQNESNALVIGIWSEYIDPTILTEFQNKQGVQIQVVNYDSNESLDQKLKGTVIDLFVPSDYFLTHLLNNNQIEEINYSKLSFTKEDYIEPLVKRIDGSNDNKEILNYGVPYFWGYNALSFRDEATYNKVEAIVGEEGIKDMSFLYNDKVLALSDVKIGIVDDRSFLIPIGLRKLGKDYLNPKTIEEAEQALDAIRPYLSKWTIVEDPTIDDQLRSNQIQVAFTYSGWTNCLFTCDDEVKAKVVPLNTSHLWIDLMAINKFSEKKILAYKFIDFVMKKENQLKNVSEIGDFTIIQETYNEALNQDLISQDVEILSKLIDASSKLKYELVSSENFFEVKKAYDTVRA